MGRLTSSYPATPADDVLRERFLQYAKEKNGSGLTAAEQIARLRSDLGFDIR